MTWKAQGEHRALVTLVVSSRIPDAALRMAGISRNVKVFAALYKDSNGNYYFSATGQQLTQTIANIGRLGAMAAAAAGAAFGPGNGAGAVNVNVQTATARFVPNGRNLRMTVYTDFTLQIGNISKRIAKNHQGYAVPRGPRP